MIEASRCVARTVDSCFSRRSSTIVFNSACTDWSVCDASDDSSDDVSVIAVIGEELAAVGGALINAE